MALWRALVAGTFAVAACAVVVGPVGPVPAETRAPVASAVARPLTGSALGTAAVRAPSRHRCATAIRRCEGAVRVPLDRTDPQSGHIDVAFAFLPRTDQNRPALGTVFVNDGGPGAVIGQSESVIRSALGPVLRRQNLLLLDPRGFGRSSPRTCARLDVDSDASIAACARRLGAFATNLTSAAFAADLDAVRGALGLPTLTVYGNSYGTVFAQAYSTRYPQRTAAVFLDSVVATRTDGYGDDLGPLAAGVGMLGQVCAASTVCRAANPDPVGRLAAVLDKARAGLVRGLPVDRLAPMVWSIYDAVTAREVVAALRAADTGDPAPLARLARAYAPPPGGLDLDGPDFAAVLAYACSDYRYDFDRAASPEQRREQLARARLSSHELAPFTAQDLPAVARRDYPDWCTNWPTPRETPVVPPRAAHPPVPTLVVNGQLDTTTPPAGAAAVAGRYPRGRFVSVPFGDHASSFGLNGGYSLCVRGMMRAFLAAPSGSLTVPACDAELLRPLGRFPRQAAHVPPAILVGPSSRPGTRRLVAVAHATAVDALARLAPPAPVPPGRHRGLRGGTITYRPDGTVRLAGVRWVADVAVTGTVRLSSSGRAQADLAVLTGGRRHRVVLAWSAWRPADAAAVSGHVDGRAVRGRVLLG